MHFSKVSYDIQPQKSKDWSTLYPNPVYSLLSMSQTKCHTHIYKKYHINTNTRSYFNQHAFRKQEREQNILRL